MSATKQERDLFAVTKPSAARIWVLSDLHVDYCPWTLPEDVPEHDVVVIAGDVRDRLTSRVVPWLATNVVPRGRPVVYVPGNHDFYRTNYDREIAKAAELRPAGVTILTDGSAPVEVAGVRFAGATLWTDFRVHGDPAGSLAAAGSTMNDYRLIRSGPEYRRFSPAYASVAHGRAYAALAGALATPSDVPTVVVTHHAPSARSLDGRLPREALDGAYASALDDFVGSSGAALWIHGHVHESKDYLVGSTRVLSNPRGYVTVPRKGKRGEVEIENPAFDPRLVVTVGG